jgi:hypothetical protein
MKCRKGCFKNFKGVVVHDTWKILAPVDLTSEAEARVQHALDVAEAVQGDLTMLYVLNRQSKRAEPVEWPANAMAAHVRRLAFTGSIADKVGRYADDLGADLITVTAGPYRGWHRLWKKSAAAAIAKATDRPMCFTSLSAPAPATAFKSILCVVPLDGSDEPLVRFSEELAQRCDATLVFLYVLPEVSEGLIACGIPGADDRPLGREVAEHRLKELTAGLYLPHLTAITTGSAYRSIANLAREHKADVVIAGRSDGAPYDLDAGALLSRVSCPVISVPARSPVPRGSSAMYRRQRAVELSGSGKRP